MIQSVLTTPAPEVEVSKFTPEGPLLTLRAYSHTYNYWKVYFEINPMIVRAFAEAG